MKRKKNWITHAVRGDGLLKSVRGENGGKETGKKNKDWNGR